MDQLKIEGEKVADLMRQRDAAFSRNAIGEARGLNSHIEKCFERINKLDMSH
jgi:hypothetical protein